MKLSETKNISEILKKIGIHEDPKNMSTEDLENLAKNPICCFLSLFAFAAIEERPLFP